MMQNAEETADKIDDEVSLKKDKKIFYCTSCNLITMSNPAVNVQGVIKHLESDHPKYNNSYWPNIEKLFRSYNLHHQGS